MDGKRGNMTQFKDLNLNANIQAALDKLGFTEPTEIQAKAIPVLLENETDFHGQAQTGTGKTLAFGIPLVQKIDPSKRVIQALIVAPTRELVLQIVSSLEPICKNANISVCPVYGGVSIIKQITDLRRAHIVVGTPGRLNDHLNRKTLVLKDLDVLVLDEADIMLDMGFKEEIDEILKFAPENRRIWLFSATVKPGISDIKNSHMKNVVTVRVSANKIGTQNTKQFYCIASSSQRLNALCSIVDSDPEFYGFIFCPTKMLTAEISEKLSAHGYDVNCLHGDMNQASRTKVIQQFRDKKFSILVATDVAARGIDVPDITHVVNYALPNDHENYVHRIGRTGRAGKTGTAITLINGSEIRKIKSLGSRFNVEIQAMNVPQMKDLLEIQAKKMQECIAKFSEKSELATKYSKELEKTLATFSPEVTMNILHNMLADKFFQKFEANLKAEKIAKSSDRSERSDRGDRYGRNDRFDRGDRNADAARFKEELIRNDLIELKIDLGSSHGITERDITKYLADNGKILPNELSKLKVLREKSYIALSTKKANELLPLLKNTQINGKRARVYLAN